MKKSKKLDSIWYVLREEVQNRKTSILQNILRDDTITNCTKQLILKKVKQLTDEDSNHKDKVSKRKHMGLIESIESKFLKTIGVQDAAQDVAEQDVLSVLSGVTLETLPPEGAYEGEPKVVVGLSYIWSPCVANAESGWPAIGETMGIPV